MRGLGLGWSVIAGQVQAAPSGDAPTYHRDVEPILQRHCQECHRPGQVAPLSLMDYAQARKMAPFLANVTRDRQMPPWHASTTEGGPFRDARVLSDGEIADPRRVGQGGRPGG